MNKANAYIATGVTVLVLLGSAIETSETMPDNAIIYGNSLNKTYYGEPTRKNKMIIRQIKMMDRQIKIVNNKIKMMIKKFKLQINKIKILNSKNE